jgi:hypothetical protein
VKKYAIDYVIYSNCHQQINSTNVHFKTIDEMSRDISGKNMEGCIILIDYYTSFNIMGNVLERLEKLLQTSIIHNGIEY